MDNVLIDPFADLPDSFRRGVIAFGNFEGIHRGHCRLLARLRDRARSVGGPAVAISFEPHPLKLLRPQAAPPALVWAERKRELLLACGADAACILRTTPEFLNLSAEDFFENIVLGKFAAQAMVEGRNFGYGKDRGGNIQILGAQCQRAGLSLDVVDIVTGAGDSEVSSTRIRREIADGRLDIATQLLGRPHRIAGTVIAGDKRGRQIGFPTANLANVPVLLPKEGVYAGLTTVDDKRHAVAINIGANPTFGINERKVEAHILDFAGDIYDRWLEIDLVAHLRDVQTFAGIDALKTQLATDILRAREVAESYRPPFGTDLGQTITEWLRSEVEPGLVNVNARIVHARLDQAGHLTILIHAPIPLPPPLLSELCLRMDERISKVFEEVKRVRWETR